MGRLTEICEHWLVKLLNEISASRHSCLLEVIELLTIELQIFVPATHPCIGSNHQISLPLFSWFLLLRHLTFIFSFQQASPRPSDSPSPGPIFVLAPRFFNWLFLWSDKNYLFVKIATSYRQYLFASRSLTSLTLHGDGDFQYII